jgi:Leucine-rich repeat (LRR) protein
LDQLNIGTIKDEDKDFLEKFINVEFLSINSAHVKSLANFPTLPKLKRLELNDNSIPDEDLKLLSIYPNLAVLKLAGNHINSLESLEVLAAHTDLINIDFTGNPVADKENYRSKVYEILKSVEILDAEDKEGNEVISDEDEDGQEEDEYDFGEGEEEEIDEETYKKLLAEGKILGF